MKKIVLLSTAALLLSSCGAYADGLYIGIGEPQIAPVYVEPAPVPYYYHTRYYYERHHDYDWR